MSSTSVADRTTSGASDHRPHDARVARRRAQAIGRAIPLDAAMTTAQALERLADYHAWFDDTHPVVRALFARRAAESERAPEEVARELAEAFALANGKIDDERRTSLARPPEHVAVRRVEDLTVYWYRRSTDEVRWRLLDAHERQGPDTPVAYALELHEYTSERSVQRGAFLRGEQSGTVVLDGGVLVGVARPLLMAGAPDDGAVRGAPPPPPPSAVPRSRSAGPSAVPAPPAPAAPAPGRAAGGMHDYGSGGGARPAVEQLPVPEPPVVVAHPHVAAPTHAVVGERIEVELGLAAAPTPGVLGDAMALPVSRPDHQFDVEVRIAADGFDAPDGWVRRLRVPAAALDSVRATLPLVARPPVGPSGVGVASLLVHFVVDGVLRGSASRVVVVLPHAGADVPAIDPRGTSLAEQPPTRPFRTGPAGARADVEIIIGKPDRNPMTGRFSLALRSPHLDAGADALPDIDLGSDAQTFAKLIIDQVRQHDGRPLAANLLASIGVRIAAKLPREFWAAFDRVVAQLQRQPGPDARRPPTVLLLASENLVPWELAALPRPIDPALPNFLAAQTRMGRWILDEGTVPQPPSSSPMKVERMVALAGHYAAETGLEPLPHAVAEAGEIGTRFAAVVRLASSDTLGALLDAQLEVNLARGGAEVVHFAGHGEIDPRHPGTGGIYLEDGTAVHPLLFTSSVLGTRHRPFVFFNACMVGTGGELLGDCGGFPGECLTGGFRGLVAPLWAVRDTLAKEIALEFYQRTLDDGQPVADVLHRIRARYRDTVAAGAPQPTYLAYVFYGHPALALAR